MISRVDWHGDLAPYVSGGTEPWAVSVLQALVRLRRPFNLLELGTYEGRTTRALANVMPPLARLWTVDQRQRHVAFEDHRIIFTESDATEFLRANPIAWDFAFVDDNHNKPHVAEEVEMLLRCMMPGGLIVGHDVLGAFDLADVFTSRGGFIVELPLLHAAGALGVIEVPTR